MHQQGPLQINHEQEDITIGAYGSRSHGGHKLYREDTIRDGRLLDTLDRRGDGHGYYSSYGYDINHDRHCYHPYRRSDRGYFPDEFKKEKPPTFDGDVKKPERNCDSPSSSKCKEKNQGYNRRNPTPSRKPAPRRNVDDVKEARGNGYHQRISRQQGFRSTSRKSPSPRY